MDKLLAQLLAFMVRNDKRILWFLVAFVIIAGVPYSFNLGSKLPYSDEQSYHLLATNLATKHCYSYDCKAPTAYRPPGYPLILAFAILLGADIPHLRVINFIALGLSLVVLRRILIRHASRMAAIVGMLAVVCYPVLFYTAGTLFPQTVAALLLLLCVALLTKDTVSVMDSLFAGLLYGLLILTVPSFAFTFLVLAGWIWFYKKTDRVKVIAITSLVIATVMAPWTVRNYLVYHSFIHASTNSGVMLLYGNSENTTPNSGPNVDISKYESQTKGMNDAERDSFFKSMAVKYVTQHKREATALYALKVLNYFNYRNELKTKAEGSAAKDLVMLFTYMPLLLLFLVRLLLLRRFRLTPLEQLASALYLTNAFWAAVFFTRVRYRLPFDYLLIVVAAMLVDSIARMWLKKRELLPDVLIDDKLGQA